MMTAIMLLLAMALVLFAAALWPLALLMLFCGAIMDLTLGDW